MNWKITTKEREDGMWEAKCEEIAGLFVIGVAVSKESAIDEAQFKARNGRFDFFYETPEDVKEWERLEREEYLKYKRKFG